MMCRFQKYKKKILKIFTLPNLHLWSYGRPWAPPWGQGTVTKLVPTQAIYPRHENWPSSSMAKRAIRVEKSGSWEVLDW